MRRCARVAVVLALFAFALPCGVALAVALTVVELTEALWDSLADALR